MSTYTMGPMEKNGKWSYQVSFLCADDTKIDVPTIFSEETFKTWEEAEHAGREEVRQQILQHGLQYENCRYIYNIPLAEGARCRFCVTIACPDSPLHDHTSAETFSDFAQASEAVEQYVRT